MADITEYDQPIVVTPIVSGMQCSVVYREGKFVEARYRGDGIMGALIPKYVCKQLFPQRLDTDVLYLQGFITLTVDDEDDRSEFSTDIVYILRDRQSFKEYKSRLRFIATQCLDSYYADLNLLESLDLLGDIFETRVTLSTTRGLLGVIANLYERDVKDELYYDGYSIREVTYNDLTTPWSTDYSVLNLIIPFYVAKSIRKKT